LQAFRSTKTTRPIQEDDVCPFNFNIFWEETTSRWYFDENGRGNNMHAGHAKKEYLHVAQPSKNVGQENINIAMDMLSQNIGAASVRAFALRAMDQLSNDLMAMGFKNSGLQQSLEGTAYTASLPASNKKKS
jgi:hypothetical protein